MKILFTGGGSGGHIFPIIAITREIRRIYPMENLSFYYIGPKDEFSSVLLSQEGIKVKTILAGKIRRYLSIESVLENIIDILFRIPFGILQAFNYIFFLAPDIIFSKGGYGSIPVVISGWILGVPIFLHEGDIAPGLSNKIVSKFSWQIFTSFPKTKYFPSKKILLVGNPIRKEILEGNKEEAKELLNLTYEKPIILILGGSQGAKRINDRLLTILQEALKSFEIIHQTGTRNFQEIKAQANANLSEELKKYYHPISFLKEEELKQAYAAADLIVSRAGAGSIFEIAALHKPSILIPLPDAAQNHQIENAYAYASEEAAIVMEEVNFTPHFFLEKVKYLLSTPNEFEKMQKAAEEFSRPKSAIVIASYLVEYLIKK